MAVIYTWDCNTVEVHPTLGEREEVIHAVHWKLKGTDEDSEESATFIGAQSIGTEDLEDFTEYADLTHEAVVEWVEGLIGEEEVASMKESVAASLVEKITPTSVTKNLSDRDADQE